MQNINGMLGFFWLRNRIRKVYRSEINDVIGHNYSVLGFWNEKEINLGFEKTFLMGFG